MSEQRAVPEIPKDFTVRCHDCGGTQIWKRVNAGEIETHHGCFNGKQSREAFAALTAERDALSATLRQGAESDEDLRTRYTALEKERDALKQQLADSELAFNHANEVVGKQEADVARLSAPVTDEENCEGCDKVLAENEGQSDHGGNLLCAECWLECANDPTCHEDECECRLCKPAPSPRHRWVHHCRYDEQQCDAACRRAPTTLVCSKCGVRKSNLPAKCASRTAPAKETK